MRRASVPKSPSPEEPLFGCSHTFDEARFARNADFLLTDTQHNFVVGIVGIAIVS